MSDNTTPGYRLANVTEGQTVILARLSDCPNVRGYAALTDVVPGEVVLRYSRNARSDWSLERLIVKGHRAKKDGTAGRLEQNAEFWASDIRDGSVPQWLIELAAKFLPNDSRTAAYLPGMPGADATGEPVADLDALH